MQFTDTLWQSTVPIYEAILAHPFNLELAAGTLAADRFSYYVQQDELYIKSYTRALALLAAKAPHSDIANELLSYAKDGIQIERALHNFFFQTFEIELTNEMQPACLAYSSFLLAASALEPFAVGMAALLPCFWIYREVGHDIAKKSRSGNPYFLWIDTYTDATYDRIVDRMIEITNDLAQKESKAIRQKMAEHFLQSTRLEYLFWHAAYNLEHWPQ